MVKIEITIEQRKGDSNTSPIECRIVTAEFENTPTEHMIRERIAIEFPGWRVRDWAKNRYRVILTETTVRRRTFERESSMSRAELESRMEALLGGRIDAVPYFGGRAEQLYAPKLDVSVIPLPNYVKGGTPEVPSGL